MYLHMGAVQMLFLQAMERGQRGHQHMLIFMQTLLRQFPQELHSGPN